MEFTLRPMLPAERNYSYTQHQQLLMQTGCIGHLRADMDTDGTGFFSSWDDHYSTLKTDAFKKEFDEVIHTLRFDERYGGVLKNRHDLATYCNAHPTSRFDGTTNREYGFRADTGQYSYLFRLNPEKGEYNVYCYCYKREWLEQHIRQAEKGIQFITSEYQEKFRLPDGESVLITRSNGEQVKQPCRYIDETHMVLGSNLYHICQLAEMLERNGSTIAPINPQLPKECYALIPSSGEVVRICRGEMGHYPTEICFASKADRQQFVDSINKKFGVSKAQEAAMLTGSMFGWNVPGADPRNYTDQGKPIKSAAHEKSKKHAREQEI